MKKVYTLNFKGLVDPPVGRVVGPRLDGRYLEIIGAFYRSETDTTSVQLEAV